MKNYHYICNIKFTKMEDINRLKVVLAEKKRTNKWLAEQMGVNPTTVSKWLNKDELESVNWLPADWEVVKHLLKMVGLFSENDKNE